MSYKKDLDKHFDILLKCIFIRDNLCHSFIEFIEIQLRAQHFYEQKNEKIYRKKRQKPDFDIFFESILIETIYVIFRTKLHKFGYSIIHK